MINESQHVGIEHLYGGNVTPVDCFREMVQVYTGNTIGVPGGKRFVPWLGKITTKIAADHD